MCGWPAEGHVGDSFVSVRRHDHIVLDADAGACCHVCPRFDGAGHASLEGGLGDVFRLGAGEPWCLVDLEAEPVSRAVSESLPEARGFENIIRGDATLTMRLMGRHAIALKYVASHREAHYPDLGDRHQTMGTVGLYYTWLGTTRLGAVEWRDEPTH